jgi:hypothetical protein
MTLSMYQASVPVFQRGLGILDTVLNKAEAHAAARQIDPGILISLRLYPDMFPLSRQVRIANDSAKWAIARLSGGEAPPFEGGEATFEELRVRGAHTQSFLDGFKPDQIDGTEAKHIEVTVRETVLKFSGQQFLLEFALPTFYFHLSTAYGILRHAGVELSKRDYLGVHWN